MVAYINYWTTIDFNSLQLALGFNLKYLLVLICFLTFRIRNIFNVIQIIEGFDEIMRDMLKELEF